MYSPRAINVLSLKFKQLQFFEVSCLQAEVSHTYTRHQFRKGIKIQLTGRCPITIALIIVERDSIVFNKLIPLF